MKTAPDRDCRPVRLIRTMVITIFILFSTAIPATPLGFEGGPVSYLTNPYSVTTSNFHFQESFGASYRLSGGLQNFGINFTATPTDWVLDLLGVESVLGVGKTGETTVWFSTTLRLTGDAGARALITGYTSLDGWYNHQISSTPTGDARSKVSSTITLDTVSIYSQSIERNHNDYWFYTDLTIEEMTGMKRWFDPFEMTVGDTLHLGGTFTTRSFAQIDEVCIPIIGCVPGAGLALSQTTGSFQVGLNATELVADVPEADIAALLLVAGLAGVLLLRHRSMADLAAH